MTRNSQSRNTEAGRFSRLWSSTLTASQALLQRSSCLIIVSAGSDPLFMYLFFFTIYCACSMLCLRYWTWFHLTQTEIAHCFEWFIFQKRESFQSSFFFVKVLFKVWCEPDRSESWPECILTPLAAPRKMITCQNEHINTILWSEL